MSGKRSQEPGNGITGSAAEAGMGRYSCVRRDTGDRDRKKHFCQTRFRLISGVMKQHGSRKKAVMYRNVCGCFYYKKWNVS